MSIFRTAGTVLRSVQSWEDVLDRQPHRVIFAPIFHNIDIPPTAQDESRSEAQTKLFWKHLACHYRYAPGAASRESVKYLLKLPLLRAFGWEKETKLSFEQRPICNTRVEAPDITENLP